MKRSLVIVAALMAAAMVFAVLTGCEGPGAGGGGFATCTVTFDADGGTFSEDETTQSLTVNRGASVATMPANPEKDGYTFGGWYTGQNGSVTPFTASTPVTGNITVYAKWTINQYTVRYTVTFDADGGSPATQTRTVNSGASVGSLPTAPTNGEYNFGGWYTARNGGARFTGSTIVSADITVYAKWMEIQYKVSLADVTAYLTDAPGGASADDPVPLPVYLDLDASNWAALLDVIAGANKYVALDLSACTLSGTEFNPGAANTGKDKIVSLVLPDAATSIKASNMYNPTFIYFSALKSVSGSGIVTVGEAAFYNCTALTEVNLPAATDIGESAFRSCWTLTTVDLPAATSIGHSAFVECTALTTVNLPKATDIGDAAFSPCPALKTVNLPEATTIGVLAFLDCEALTTVNLPKATDIGNNAFLGCTALTTVSLANTNVLSDFVISKLTTVSLPAATTIVNNAFANCSALTTVNLPKARSIGNNAFANCAALTTVTLGSKAPTLGTNMFSGISAATVTVKVPNDSEDYGGDWGNGFRGGGWNGTATTGGLINSNITLVIEYGP